MENILHSIDMNIARKRVELMKKQLHNMNEDVNNMNNTLNSINKVHDKLLYKKEPVGRSSNAIKYLKLQR